MKILNLLIATVFFAQSALATTSSNTTEERVYNLVSATYEMDGSYLTEVMEKELAGLSVEEKKEVARAYLSALSISDENIQQIEEKGGVTVEEIKTMLPEGNAYGFYYTVVVGYVVVGVVLVAAILGL